MKSADIPMIAHVVHRFDYGGLENGLVNIINRLPRDRFRHAVIALTSASEFAGRIQRDDVDVYSIGKRPGKDFAAYRRLYALLRKLKPAVLHTRNFGTLDCAIVGRVAGIRTVVHGEHGWDVQDPDGTNKKYRRLRRMIGRLVSRFVAVSPEIRTWLVEQVGIAESKVAYICNGVDTARFEPAVAAQAAATVVVGSVTRFEDIKDPLNLVQAFISARPPAAAKGIDLRLVMLGSGSLHGKAVAALESAGVADFASLPGACDSVAEKMRRFDLFVLGSRREGISNTILEAMASGLPIVATRTGGNVELLQTGETGTLVPTEDAASLSEAILAYALDPELRKRHGDHARQAAEQRFSLQRMIADYAQLYDGLLAKGGH